ncbi:glycoside hydrolase family 2 TIM barrel-domain containing protein [Catenovulum agarivorans]|uniref:glycoside hydrolase family 2 TIM barrel-domain containing protein n=1 Tax=Catenovulum agarivorans TaxID=1172192 RepID=UPI001ED9609A|nr:glycoside hydrolase family 2 TIM barrel-domain containing protein [Catenovulum agarivorans]
MCLAFITGLIFIGCASKQQVADIPATALTEVKMLSGTGSDDAVEWDFYCNKGNNCGEWTKIPVPSNWEQQGFGNYDYGYIPEKHDEQGIYRRQFDVPAEWQDRTIEIVFDGVMTDATVLVNGEQVGPTHQGGFYRFSFDITPFVKVGQQNELKVIVDKMSADKSIEAAERNADYWVFGGIYRQVFLQSLPTTHVDWVSLDAQASGEFKMDVYLDGLENANVSSVTAQILDLDGKTVGKEFVAVVSAEKARLATQIDSPKLWTAETPNLYQVQVQVKQQNQILHTLTKTFGFRTFELRPHDGLYLNGEKIILKGVNRHSFRPETGRTMTKQASIDDINLIKSMNMNAVRMAHYPPDVHFLEAADRMGIYVINELGTWQKPVLDTAPARRLIAQMIKRDQTHPSILFWANGNEGGWNTEVDDDYDIYDLQKRPVLHPWELFRNIDTDHYPTYSELLAKKPQNEVFFPTEFLHGLYDGGHGAGLRDFWDFMMSTPLGAGGFLWVMADEGIVRTDKNNIIDTDFNHAPDGIVGPHGQKEASYFTIKEIWSPIQVTNLKNGRQLPASFNGELQVKNLYDFIDLSSFAVEWRLFSPLTAFSAEKKLVANGRVSLPATKPDATGALQLNLPENWQQQGWLEVEFFDQENNSILTNAWPIQTAAQLAKLTQQDFVAKASVAKQAEIVEQTDKVLKVTAADRVITFDGQTGLLQSYKKANQAYALTNGPKLLRSDNSLNKGVYNGKGTWTTHDPTVDAKSDKATELKTSFVGNDLVIEVVNPSAGITKLVWIVHPQGHLSMDVNYWLNGQYILHGVGFDYPKQGIAHKRWMGDGPYRVWANRLEGVNFSVWENDYNEGVAGEKWEFPEFKGYFSDIQWLTLGQQNNEITFSTATPDLYVRVMQPDDGDRPDNTLSLKYDGEISFLHRISAIGSKFHAAHYLGPQGRPVSERGISNIKLTIY